MIFDWIENCKQIIKTKHFPNSDGHEKKTMMLQHIILFKYLEDQEKKTREEVKQFWLTTDSIYLTNIPDDDKDKWIDIQFEKLWKLRTKNAINFVEGQMVYNFPIYQEEIDYINSLDCSTWLRKALLLLLACAKHNKTGLLKYNNTTTAWIEKMINPNKKVRDKMLKIGMLNVKYKLFEFTNFGSSTNKIRIRFMKNKGTPVAIVYSPNFMKDVLDLIEEQMITCCLCKKKFIPSKKQQTNLCPDCYIIQRKKDRHKAIKRSHKEGATTQKHLCNI